MSESGISTDIDFMTKDKNNKNNKKNNNSIDTEHINKQLNNIFNYLKHNELTVSPFKQSGGNINSTNAYESDSSSNESLYQESNSKFDSRSNSNYDSKSNFNSDSRSNSDSDSQSHLKSDTNNSLYSNKNKKLYSESEYSNYSNINSSIFISSKEKKKYMHNYTDSSFNLPLNDSVNTKKYSKNYTDTNFSISKNLKSDLKSDSKKYKLVSDNNIENKNNY